MSDFQSVSVMLPDHTDYGIFIRKAPNINFLQPQAAYLAGKTVLLVSDETVSGLYAELVERLLIEIGVNRVISYVFSPGEPSKTLVTISEIYDAAFSHGFGRDGCVVALGGGIVGDVAGFAASSIMRGVEFIQIPTTLLAQIDSSVGGKTGVNHPKGKNLIGAFKQPKAVFIATDFLQTLPQREVSAGIAEIIKYGLIADANFYNWLLNNINQLASLQSDALHFAIHRSCEIKADVVAQDEKENGIRAILNFGHTFGHAIEQVLGYGCWLHGEAVGLGMLMALELSCRLGYLERAVIDQAETLLAAVALPVRLPEGCDVEQLIAAMASDKKVQAGKLRFVVLSAIGQAMILSDPSVDEVQKSVLAFQS